MITLNTPPFPLVSTILWLTKLKYILLHYCTLLQIPDSFLDTNKPLKTVRTEPSDYTFFSA